MSTRPTSYADYPRWWQYLPYFPPARRLPEAAEVTETWCQRRSLRIHVDRLSESSSDEPGTGLDHLPACCCIGRSSEVDP